MTPSISVIIPLYNAAEFFTQAIESIFAQEIKPLEILVVNDGSTDNSLEIARQLAAVHPEIRFWSQENGGPSKARNSAIKQAKGDVIFFLDADDEFAPKAFVTQLEQLKLAQQAYGELTAVRGKLQLLNKTEGRWLLEDLPYDLNAMTGIMPRVLFGKVGLFDESLRGCEDSDWWLRAEELGVHIATHDHVILYYRRHDSNATLNTALMKSERLRLFKKVLDRKRARAKEVNTS